MSVSFLLRSTEAPRAGLGDFGSAECTWTPAAALRPWLTDVHVLSMPSSSPGVIARLPDGATSLVVCARATGSVDVVAIGPRLRAFYKQASSMPLYTRFTFRPGGARAFFGVPLHEMCERAVPIDELWGPHAAPLHADLARARGAVDATIRAVESALCAQLDRLRASVSRVALVGRAAQAFDAFDADHGEPERMRTVARQLGVSERQLRQLFADEVGISPKRYARIARIHRAVARAGRARWAEIAAASGFYDQAHLTAEFRDLLGVTPRAFVAGDVPVQCGPC